MMSRLLVIAKIRDVNLVELLKYSLSPVPPALANYDGTMAKTNKADIIHLLESEFKEAIIENVPHGSVVFIDGMAMLQQTTSIPATFGELADQLLHKIINLAIHIKSSRVDFVIDRYPPLSIKTSKRQRRANSGTQLIRVHNKEIRKHRTSSKLFLSNGANKESLVDFLFDQWKNCQPAKLQNVTLVVAHGSECHAPTSSQDEAVRVNEITCLNCDHEEADTRMFLHALHAANGGAENIIIMSPDTDVKVLALGHAPYIGVHMFIKASSGFLSITKLHEHHGFDVCHALMGLHVFSGCDPVSAFKGKGKHKAFKLMCTKTNYTETFSKLGEDWIPKDDLLANLEAFVCALHGQPTCNSVDAVRYNIFRKGFKSDIALPPNQDCLKLHSLHANY